jgi:hypothetical protein
MRSSLRTSVIAGEKNHRSRGWTARTHLRHPSTCSWATRRRPRGRPWWPAASTTEDGADLVGAAKVLSELGHDGLLDHGVLLVFEVDVVARIVLMDACFMYTIPCSLKLMGSDGVDMELSDPIRNMIESSQAASTPCRGRP